LDLAYERGKVDAITDDMRLLNGSIDGSRELEMLLLSPIVKGTTKRQALDALLKARVQIETLAFIHILISKRREQYLGHIAMAFLDLYNERQQITPATLVTASEAGPAFKAQVVELLRRDFGKSKVELATETDESIIGGFVLRFDDKLIDSSIGTQLKSISKELQSTSFSKN
jgi:F-type H+-transporting ATPase subunit delta